MFSRLGGSNCMFRTFSRTTLTIDVGRRGGDIVEHGRGGNIATEVVTR